MDFVWNIVLATLKIRVDINSVNFPIFSHSISNFSRWQHSDMLNVAAPLAGRVRQRKVIHYPGLVFEEFRNGLSWHLYLNFGWYVQVTNVRKRQLRLKVCLVKRKNKKTLITRHNTRHKHGFILRINIKRGFILRIKNLILIKSENWWTGKQNLFQSKDFKKKYNTLHGIVWCLCVRASFV